MSSLVYKDKTFRNQGTGGVRVGSRLFIHEEEKRSRVGPGPYDEVRGGRK